MTRIAVYTSFAANYLAKARVLAQSLKTTNPDIDVVAVICDKLPIGVDPACEPFDQIWMIEEYSAQPVKAWIFRHTIMELCTAVKGWGLQRLLTAGYDFVFYLDPDCWVLEDLSHVIAVLRNEMSVLVVPHTTVPAETDEGIRLIEISSLKHGIYNLGFLLVRNDQNGRRFAAWWAERLHKHCLIRFEDGIFTDQRWFDLACGYFPFIQVGWHKGIDVASWNVGQRSITRAGPNTYLIDGDPLVFYHFSGVGPAGVHRWVREIFAPSDPLAAELEFRYEQLVNQAGQQRFANMQPAYDFYGDGEAVTSADRALYRAKEEENKRRFPDPYDAGRDAPFRQGESERLNADYNSLRHKVEYLARRLFHQEFYRRSSGNDAAAWDDYVNSGWLSSANPNRYFDHRLYIGQVPSPERARFATPLHHFVAIGKKAGLAPAWFFDELYYVKRHSDVSEAIARGEFSCGLEHFIGAGYSEGRRSSALFDEANYVRTNKDVGDAVAAGLFANGGEHYIAFGMREGRTAIFGGD